MDVCFFFSKKTWWRWWSFTYRWLNHFLRWPKNCSDKIFTSKSRRFSQVFSIFVSRLSWMFSCKQIFIPHTRTSDFWLWKLKNSKHFGELVNKKVEVLVEQNHSLSSNQKKTWRLHCTFSTGFWYKLPGGSDGQFGQQPIGEPMSWLRQGVKR